MAGYHENPGKRTGGVFQRLLALDPILQANRTETVVTDAIELSVVVPIYNEEESVGPLVMRISEAMAGFGAAGN